MDIEFDGAKSERNVRERGIPFSSASDFDWSTAKVGPDLRRDYGERRFRALGLIGERIHILIFTVRGERLRVISLRRANDREVRVYEEA